MPHLHTTHVDWKLRAIFVVFVISGALIANLVVVMKRGSGISGPAVGVYNNDSIEIHVYDTHILKSLIVIGVLLLAMRVIRSFFASPLTSNTNIDRTLGPHDHLHIQHLEVRGPSIMDAVFAASLYRHELTRLFAAFVTVLLVVKCLHIYTSNRMDLLEKNPLMPRIQHIRHLCLMFGLFILDIHLIFECVKYHSVAKSRSMLGMFAFEFIIRLIEVVSLFTRYIFHTIDIRCEGRWNEKGSYTYCNELIAHSSSLLVYFALFAYLSTHQAFPLYVVLEFSSTFSRFRRCLNNFLRYRRVVMMMNEIFADATEQDLNAENKICSICHDDMECAKKLDCGHVFHKSCLQSWLKLQLICPVCRKPVNALGEADAAFRGARGHYDFGFTTNLPHPQVFEIQLVDSVYNDDDNDGDQGS